MCVFGDKHQDIITTYPCVNLENQSSDKTKRNIFLWRESYHRGTRNKIKVTKQIITLVMMDHFTKWFEAFASTDQKASTVTHILVSCVFSRFCPPTIIHSDQGKNFDTQGVHLNILYTGGSIRYFWVINCFVIRYLWVADLQLCPFDTYG